METATVEIRLTLTERVIQKLHATAQARGMTDDAIVEQALGLLFELDETPVSNDYWFSVATMREDWETMPEDWISDEVSHALPAR